MPKAPEGNSLMNTMIYPTTNFKAIEQLVVARGEGVYVFDADGKRYLEGMAGLWCTALGYGNEKVSVRICSVAHSMTSSLL